MGKVWRMQKATQFSIIRAPCHGVSPSQRVIFPAIIAAQCLGPLALGAAARPMLAA